MDGRLIRSLPGSLPVVVVNETLSRQLSPIIPAVGLRITTPYLDATVIGVMRDLVEAGPDIPATPLILHRAEHRTSAAQLILVRTAGPATPLLQTLRGVVEEEFGPMRSTQLRLMADDVETDLYTVAWPGSRNGPGRTHELGIRLALGAEPAQARAFVLAHARRIVMVGAAVGIAAGMLAGRPVVRCRRHQWRDHTRCRVAGRMGWCSAYLPALRASRIDPAVVLRAD